MCDMIMYVKEQHPWGVLFADDIMLCSSRIEQVDRTLEEWRRSVEERGLEISRKQTE